MYYDSKSSFYVKQYGSTVIVTVLSILLIISSSVVFYFLKFNPDVALEQANKDTNTQLEENVDFEKESLKEEVTKTSAYFDNLGSSKFSDVCVVTGIKNSNQITIETEDSMIDVQLIGVNLDYVDVNKYINKLRNDLLTKEVKIVFDKELKTNNIYNVYMYVNNELYNADVLRSGTATLKSERINIALTKTLGEAQKYARDSKNGVWSK